MYSEKFFNIYFYEQIFIFYELLYRTPLVAAPVSSCHEK